ncbi:protocadherin gamma-C5-like isoform X3 [Xyrauchen texanus]|uniref:protocadherin gamma-C5-like isoform X3 n=1 Tax=Xyrauchen texanus TaxID=154827 RepID=UPI0022418CD9|nr:protocadherin gamma-C5-like isoform X3 [Xyrauchen texanus]
MEMRTQIQRRILFCQAVWLFFCAVFWRNTDAQLRYTIPEEQKEGSVVGNVAKDLGLDVSEILNRKLRIASESGEQYFSLNLRNGELLVSEVLDRENLCGQSKSCVLPLQIIIEDPLQFYRVEVDVQDINDNSPIFLSERNMIEVPESTQTGARFRLEPAQDPDAGSNSLRTYAINKNEHFVLHIKNNKDGTKVPEIVLEKAVDREKQSVHHLILTGIDGGDPARSGTTQITVNILDANDNAPIFEQELYEIKVMENTVPGTMILTVKAIDLDDGVNSELEYSFGVHTPELIQNVFAINQEKGELVVSKHLDYEISTSYKFDIRVRDKGQLAMESHCRIQVAVLDVNDNAPEITITSSPKPVREDAPAGTMVALINVKDLDSGVNGNVTLDMSPGTPFTLKPTFSNHYALVTNEHLNREDFSRYDIELKASDSGTPKLQSSKFITVNILDVNDNPPVFSEPVYTVYIEENSAPGSILASVTASDLDTGENAKIVYSVLDTNNRDIPVSSYLYVNSENGSIFSMHSFDYEKIKVFHIIVHAEDHGSPPLGSNATVHVFIMDKNDNVPAVIYPSSVTGSVSHQRMPRSAKTGHLVTKVTAVDADSGHNAWLFYRLAEATDASLFSVNLHTGEVRTKRSVSEQDDSSQRLLIEIKDNGDPMQSTKVTVEILIEDGFHESISDYRKILERHEGDKKTGKITLYLIISLASVSLLCVMTFFILLVKCARGSSGSSSCCIRRTNSGYKNPNRNLQIQLNSDGPIKYVEVLGGDMMSQSQSFGSYLSPMSEFSDLTLVKPSSTTNFTDTLNVLDASLPDSAWTFESQQQKPPNTDWRFPPNQRPGPSGQHRFHTLQQRWTPYEKSRAGAHPEDAGACAGVIAGTGPWPNPPTEAEQIQVLMAAANASEATATLGPRYNPQYGPDYRQNVYIPGSTATLTINPQQQIPQQALPPPQALPPAEAPKSAQTPASKKKPTKKDKK